MSNRTFGNYSEEAEKGLANQRLQASLKGIQNGMGKGALTLWRNLPDAELRKRVKQRRLLTLDNLDIVLETFAENVRKRGGHVHFAATAEDASRIVLDIARKHDVRSIVKGKSMTSAEIGIDAPLEAAGIEVTETDLGEYIIQLAGDAPSHIIAPCIHMDRKQIGELFAEKLCIEYTEDPPTLTRAARKALRKKLLNADMGLTGCNIACAETGHVSLVSNEGNIRMATTMPRVHVALMGMERIAATLEDHQGMLQLLTRGAAVQKLSTYVSFSGGPVKHEAADISKDSSLSGSSGSSELRFDPDGPESFHVVIIDNGRSRILADPEFREVLACIRCGACLNVCPVYGRIGGHAYNSPYCGPIGAVVTPLLNGVNKHADLCKGETLCGACKDVCPVENDLPRMLSGLRYKLAYGDDIWNVQPESAAERTLFRFWAWAVTHPRVYGLLQRAGRLLQKPIAREGRIGRLPLARKLTKLPLMAWVTERDLPVIAGETFAERWTNIHARRNEDATTVVTPCASKGDE